MDFSTIASNVAGAPTRVSASTSAPVANDETDAAPAPGTTSGDATTSETDSAASEQSEQFDTFLNLLTAQIRNQDPLAPLDSTQFVEQLATFSNLELQATTNQILEGISNLLASQIGEGATPEEPGSAES
ncbi:MAG: flagellar hook capping FlgD N-terminal domain-containing protein [Litorimonas sp.]